MYRFEKPKPRHGKFLGHKVEFITPHKYYPRSDPEFDVGCHSDNEMFYPAKFGGGSQFCEGEHGWGYKDLCPKHGAEYTGYRDSHRHVSYRESTMRYQRQRDQQRSHPLLNPYGRWCGLYGSVPRYHWV